MAVKPVSTCPHLVARDIDARGADALLRVAADVLARAGGASPDLAFRALSRRESAASTALGVGVAVPHARLPGLDHRLTALLRTRYPIAFRAPDHKPVNLLYAILVPEDGHPDDDVAFLGRAVEALDERPVPAALLHGTDDDALKRAFVDREEREPSAPRRAGAGNAAPGVSA